MNIHFALPPVLVCFSLVSCGGGGEEAAVQEESSTPGAEVGHVLPAREGAFWRYRAVTEIPAAARGADEDEITEEEVVRRHIGRVVAEEGRDALECFEVSTAGKPITREFVEIHPDRVMMSGSARVDDQGKQGNVVMLAPAIPLILHDMQAGDTMRDLTTTSGNASRNIRAVAIETVDVPAGSFEALRLLMTGNDGPLDLRRTIWFAMGVGIVRDETSRYREDTLLYRNVQELTEYRLEP